jgi:5-methyltetrahydrofolate--homocysteine methyltransferase
MTEILEQIAYCVEFGKINKTSPYPPNLKGQDGADELTKKALDEGIPPDDILQKAFVQAMNKVGQKFSENKIFVPQMLMSAKAMNVGMDHLKPFFQSGEVQRKGKFVIGTVTGDLHDIGKNLAGMMVEGAGWELIDLGVDVKTDQFIEQLTKDPNCVIGLSALLTTTMVNMEDTVKQIKEKYPETSIIIGGAPVTEGFKNKIGASFYAPTPQEAVAFLGN